MYSRSGGGTIYVEGAKFGEVCEKIRLRRGERLQSGGLMASAASETSPKGMRICSYGVNVLENDFVRKPSEHFSDLQIRFSLGG